MDLESVGTAIGAVVGASTFALGVWTRLVTKPINKIVECIERLRDADDKLDRRISYLEGVHDTMSLYSQTGKEIDVNVRRAQTGIRSRADQSGTTQT